jgi:hypothetical protein
MVLNGAGETKIKKFRRWLTSHGAELLPETNPYEVARFRHSAGIGVIYTNANKTRYTANNDDALSAWKCYLEAKPWVNRVPANKRGSRNIEALIKRDGEKCFFCGVHLEREDMTEEHLLALIHGGSNRLENKAIACGPCNLAVGHMSIVEKVKFRDATLKSTKPITQKVE